jgi:hypothetical protein
MQSTSAAPQFDGLHLAVIMDGNGRWARQRGLPRAAGHRAGVAAVRRIVESCPAAGIGTLTLYAFSSDNWTRPEREVAWLFRLLREHLRTETTRCMATGVRVTDRAPGPAAGDANEPSRGRRRPRCAGTASTSESPSTIPRGMRSSAPRARSQTTRPRRASDSHGPSPTAAPEVPTCPRWTCSSAPAVNSD